MPQKRMDARDRFARVKRVCSARHAVRREHGRRGIGNRLLPERMRQRFKRGIVFEREMRAFIRFDEREDRRGRVRGAGRFAQRQPVRIREARRVALPIAERGQVVAAAGHDVNV